MKSLQGHLLVASPHLPDPNFFRTVVLLVQHQKEGALGLVLNRPSRRTIREVISKVSEVPCPSDDTVGIGGPIEGPLMALHELVPYSETEVFSGVFFATQREHILEIVQQTDTQFRLFSGYAGWGGGQLERELKVGGWLTAPATADFVFRTAPDGLWKTVADQIGSRILQSAVKIKHRPDDPSLN